VQEHEPLATVEENDSMTASAPPGPKPKLRPSIVSFSAFNPATLPAREWMYGKHYQRGVVSLTVGTGGRGKTSLVLVEVIAMALCEALLGEQPTARFRAWVHCGEDDMNELLRRVAAICQRYKLTMKDLEGWLFLTSANEFPLRVAEGYNELKIDNALISHITAEIEQNAIDLAVFDPFVTLHGSSENDAGKMSRVIDIFKKIASQTECAIELVHHTRKTPPGSTRT
jgi:RecA-family ATPase